MIPFVGFQGDLLLRLHLFRLHLLDLAGENGLWLGRGVDAVGLDGDDKVAAVFQKVGCVDGDNTGLKN